MELDILLKIKENKKLYDYLHTHSYYYRLLNRSRLNYDVLLKDFKKDSRNKNINKVNEVIDNAEMISNILKVVE